MRETQRKLYQLELFEFVNVESLEDRDLQPPEVPVRITVAEGKHRKMNFGVGYGTEEQRARAHPLGSRQLLRRRAARRRRSASGRRSIAASAPTTASRISSTGTCR